MINKIHYSKDRQNDTTFEIEFHNNKFEIKRTTWNQFYWVATDSEIEMYESYSVLFDLEKDAYVNLFDEIKKYYKK